MLRLTRRGRRLSPTRSLRDVALTALELGIPCGDVQVARYCTIAILWVFDIVLSTASCQKADWTLHRQERAAIERWMNSTSNPPSVPSDAIRCLGRILWNKNILGKKSVWVCLPFPSNYLSVSMNLKTRGIDVMQSCMTYVF